jgi:hypothetical protein
MNASKISISRTISSSGADFLYIFFRGKFRGKFRGNFSTKNVGENFEFSAEKVLKNCFPKKFRGNSAENLFPQKKMYEKSTPDWAKFHPIGRLFTLGRYIENYRSGRNFELPISRVKVTH